MQPSIAIETVVAIIKDEIRMASQEQQVALRRVLHEIRYVELRTTHPEDPPRWVRKGDARIGKRGITFDSRGETIEGRITAILRYEDGFERLQVVAGTPRTGTTTLWANADDVDIL